MSRSRLLHVVPLLALALAAAAGSGGAVAQAPSTPVTAAAPVTGVAVLPDGSSWSGAEVVAWSLDRGAPEPRLLGAAEASWRTRTDAQGRFRLLLPRFETFACVAYGEPRADGALRVTSGARLCAAPAAGLRLAAAGRTLEPVVLELPEAAAQGRPAPWTVSITGTPRASPPEPSLWRRPQPGLDAFGPLRYRAEAVPVDGAVTVPPVVAGGRIRIVDGRGEPLLAADWVEPGFRGLPVRRGPDGLRRVKVRIPADEVSLGVVRAKGGEAVAAAELLVEGPTGLAPIARAAASGAARLDLGWARARIGASVERHVTVYARADGLGLGVQHGRSALIELAARPMRPLRFALGDVEIPGALEIRGMVSALHPASNGSITPWTVFWTDAEGRVAWPRDFGMPAPWRVRLAKSHLEVLRGLHGGAFSPVVPVLEVADTVDLGAFACLDLTVTAPDGTPAGGAELWLHPLPIRFPSGPWRCGADGRFRILVPPTDFDLFVQHAAGVRVVRCSAGRAAGGRGSESLALEPWGRVVLTRPPSGERVQLAFQGASWSDDPAGDALGPSGLLAELDPRRRISLLSSGWTVAPTAPVSGQEDLVLRVPPFDAARCGATLTIRGAGARAWALEALAPGAERRFD